MKHAHYDETNGKLLGWYDDKIHSEIPIPNIIVSEDEWNIAVGQYMNYVDVVNNEISKKDFRTEQEKAEQELADWKQQRELLVSQIIVEYNGIEYQGDEKSQDRMSRAINGLPDDDTTILWLSADNKQRKLTRIDLKYILALAGAEQSRLWTEGRPS